jgi:hypothetical protein
MTITHELLISSLFNPTKHENIKIKDKDKVIYKKNFKYLRMIEKMKYMAPMNVERKG